MNHVLNPSDLAMCDYHPTIRVKFGEDALAELGRSARDLGGTRALLVTDPGLIAAGHVAHALAILEEAGVAVFVFHEVEENPTTAHVRACVRFAESVGGIDLIIALGGGSSMDCAKGANFLLTNGGEMEDYWGKELAKQPLLPSIGIPTTAGTGSEAQRFALISHEETHRKMACGDIKARFRTVILDPLLLRSAPRSVAAATGMDAITHAVESYVTLKRGPFSQLFAKEAWRLLNANFEKVLLRRDDAKAWGQMLLGAHFSGAAIENSMLGAAHACANPLTARFNVTHGTAVSMMLPHVIRFNRGLVGDLYAELLAVAGLEIGSDPAATLAERIDHLRELAGLPGRLTDFGIEPGDLPKLAKEAKTQWTGTFNPRPVSESEFEALFRSAL